MCTHTHTHKQTHTHTVTTRLVSHNINWRETTEYTKIGVYFNNTKTRDKIVNAKLQKPIVFTSIKSVVRMQGPF